MTHNELVIKELALEIFQREFSKKVSNVILNKIPDLVRDECRKVDVDVYHNTQNEECDEILIKFKLRK